ncbi:dockerin type I domain-containing protein [bacterium]|nr:dockerin type I domain-containing protein [bacterium]
MNTHHVSLNADFRPPTRTQRIHCLFFKRARPMSHATPNPLRSILALLVMSLTLAVSHAAEAGGRQLTINVPRDYPTIQQAIDSSFDGDTILVSPGVYSENINLGGRELEVRSTDGAGATIVNPVSGRCLTAVGQKGAGAVLEGFTLTGGSAQYGGGVYLVESSPTLIGCVITGNTTATGSSSYDGGGVYVANASPRFVNCEITLNTAYSDGGGIYSTGSSLDLEGCLISGNTAGSYGGGLQVGGSAVLTSCEVSGNSSSSSGGGIRSGSLTLTDTVVSGNVTSFDGGGIYEASVSISGGSISGNEAGRNGGGLYSCSGQVTNGLLIGNVASSNGGGVWANSTSLTFTGCSIEESDAGGFGGAMYVAGGTPTVQSGQVRLNSAGQAGGIWVENGTLRTGNTLYCGNGVNIAGNYQDLGGNVFQGGCDGSGATTRLVPEEYATIQSAIDACFDGDVVVVGPGVYSEGLNFGGREIEVRSTDGAGATIVNPVSGRCLTAVGQKGAGAVLEGFTLTGGSAQYGGGVYLVESSPTLIGCVITGNTTATGSSSYDGGGVYVANASPRFVNCEITLNTAYSDGGGIYSTGSSLDLEGCLISGNTAGSYGGGLQVGGSAVLTSCEVSGNSSSSSGGGIRSGSLTLTDTVVSGNVTSFDGGGIYEASVSISGGSISGNEAGRNGGGLYSCSGQVTNGLLIGNVASSNGGGVWANSTSLTFTGCSIEESDAGGFGGAMYVAGGTPTVQSGQVRLNSAGQAGGIWVENGTLRTGNTLYCGNGVNIAGNYQDLGGNDFQGQCDPFCDGDVNGDTYVNGTDLGRLFSAWGICLPDETCYADFNGDGMVDSADLGILLSGWGRCPGWE